MSEEINEHNEEELNEDMQPLEGGESGGEIITKVSGMFQDWFLDYASYVI